MTVPISGPVAVAQECRHCTVPTGDGTNTCAFCRTYVPPATASQRLDVSVNRVDLLRRDLNEVLRELPADAPLMAVVDLVTALGHLRQAAVALDKAADQLEAADTEGPAR